MESEFDWVAVNITSSGSGTPFGAEDRVGARVTFGVRMADTVREIEVPVLIDGGSLLTILESRNAAVKEALRVLRKLVDDLDGHTYEQLAERQNRQDTEREEKLQASLSSSISEAFRK
ncbi:MAG TPA: hypothetical protein VF605_10645 [Allosphingosinicella sp.]|jgi:hypothetical protein